AGAPGGTGRGRAVRAGLAVPPRSPPGPRAARVRPVLESSRPAVAGKRLGADRPPDHRAEVDDRDLQDDQHEDDLPPDHPPKCGTCGRLKPGTMGDTPSMSQEPLSSLFEHGEEQGCVSLAYLNELVTELELDEEEIEGVYERLDERGIEVTDDCRRPEARDSEGTYVNGDLVAATTDALQLFLNEAGRYPLLTAAQEVALAKRIERGDAAAKDRMINSNL